MPNPATVCQVTRRKDKLVLNVGIREARQQFPHLLELLNTGKIDFVEITRHGAVQGYITAAKTPAEISQRLTTGQYAFPKQPRKKS